MMKCIADGERLAVVPMILNWIAFIAHVTRNFLTL